MNEIPLTGREMLIIMSPFIIAGLGAVVYTLWKAIRNERARDRAFKEAKKDGFLK